MSDRLQFFRKQMAAFEGAADPRQAIESGYYVEQPGKLLAKKIADRVSLRPSSAHLLVGGIGSGKTTQLLIAQDYLNAIKDTYAHYIDVSEYADFSELKPGSLLATVAASLCKSKVFKEIDNSKVQGIQRSINELVYGYYEQKPTVLNPDALLHPKVFKEGLLTKKTNIQEKIAKLIGQLYEVACQSYNAIIILLDGLDRFHDDQQFAEITESDIKAISSVGIGSIVVGSVMTAYSPYRDTVEEIFDSLEYQPCFDIFENLEARKFFLKILEVRSSPNFLDEVAAQRLVHSSGGVLRDLIKLTQTAIEEAYLADSNHIEKEHVNLAVTSFGRARILGLSEEEVGILRKVATKDDFVPRTNEDLRLLVSGRILGYRYPKVRYSVHPAILPILQKVVV